jgi:DNA-binding transcriptional regulator GbsR (MarR family)
LLQESRLIVPKKRVTAEDNRFIDEIAGLLMPWGMAPATARLYGYLLLAPEPVTLDQMAADLGISKSSASVAARLLERGLLARRFSEPGSKRIYYESAESCGSVLREHATMLAAVAEVIQQRATRERSPVASTRLTTVAGYYLAMRDAINEAMQKVAAMTSR